MLTDFRTQKLILVERILNVIINKNVEVQYKTHSTITLIYHNIIVSVNCSNTWTDMSGPAWSSLGLMHFKYINVIHELRQCITLLKCYILCVRIWF